MLLYILDTAYQVVGTLTTKGTTNKTTPYFNSEFSQDLSSGAMTLSFDTFTHTFQSPHLVTGNYIAFQQDGEYRLFQIFEVNQLHEQSNTKSVYCEMAGIELINEVVRATNLPSVNIRQALTYALQDTEYQLGKIEDSITDVLSIELTSNTTAYQFIQDYIIGEFGAEIAFRVEIQGGRVVGKFIDVFSQRGDFSGLRFEYGESITSVKKTEDATELVTALVCEGKNGTTIKDVEAEDKPLGQDWIGNEEAYQMYNRNGSHIFGNFKYDTESNWELYRQAKLALEELCKPKLKYEVEVELLGKDVNLGDTVYIVDNDFEPPLHLSARVSQKIQYFDDSKKDKVVLSNYKEVLSNITDEMREIASLIDDRFPIGSSDIQNGAVTSEKIPNNTIQSTHIVKDSITTDHLQAGSIVSDKIEAGQIKTEHILAGAVKTDQLDADSITAEKIQANAITTDKLDANSVTADKILADSITSDKINANAILTEHIQAGQVVSSHILADQINANHLQTDSVTSNKIKANAITSDKIEAGAIVSDKIDANQITATHLQTDSVTTDKIKANSITTGKIEAGAITGEKILAGEIISTHIKANQINADHLQTDSVTSDKIKANAITSDKINANQIKTEHLQAGSVDASKVTTGELITTSAQIKQGIIESSHIGEAQITNAHIGKGAIGSANILDGAIVSAKIESGQIKNAHIEDATIESAKIKSVNANTISTGTLNTSLVNIDGTNGKLRIRNNRMQVFDASTTPIERVSLGDVNGDGTVYGLRVRGADGNTILYDENGVYSEGITDGAITTDKIGDNAVDSTKLNLEELFVSEGAFINKLQATEINTSRLKVDEIRNDLINLSGLVSFDSLNPELNDLLFIKDSDKTYINGNTILTNTIKASQIDLYNGFSVQKDGLETFVISTDGSTRLRGTIESFGYSSEEGFERGYQLTPDGDAYLNNATVRGSVILPNAGVTNKDIGNASVRFWAGESYENRDSAPFRVLENGKIIATEGEFGGTFTGELTIGNITIKDTNSTEAEFSIKTNNNANEVIRLTDSTAKFNVADFSIGNILTANAQTKEVDFANNVSVDFARGNNSLELNKSEGGYNVPMTIRGVSGGVSKLKTTTGYGGLIIESSGTRANAGTDPDFDFKFRRDNLEEAVNVVINGNLVVENKITMDNNNKIELVSISGTNSGIDFMIR